ncbi:hypothetical protein DFQ28_006325 [Apophysomyces sp. BC1034]|nr:hypothetical protein DFQ28_006325 [Apophysomyces sp. BC1034]
MIKWVPGSEDLFMVSFSDGSMMLLDKEHDDQSFTSSLPQDWKDGQFHVTKPQKHSKHNPVSHWRVSAKGVADGLHIATVGKDGYLRIIDYSQERICDVFACYYGNLQCVAWSPDGNYLVVTGVAFDPWRCDEKAYRFASVGEDCNLIMWDFSVNALHRPKHVRGAKL